jgi:hypothetical protein
MKEQKKRITPSFVISVLALFLVLGGTGYAAKKITSRNIKDNTIQSRDIRDGTIGFDDLATTTKQYAYVFNLTAQSVALEAPVVFDSNGVLTSAFSHTLGTSDVTVNEDGVYDIEFAVSGTEPNQFALFLDGLPVPGSIFGSGAGTQQNNGHVILPIPAGSVLTLRNHTSAAAVGLASVVGGTQANVNASLVIKKLNDPS